MSSKQFLRGAAVGVMGVGISYKYRELIHAGDILEMDGGIRLYYPNFFAGKRLGHLPDNYDTETCEGTTMGDGGNCVTASIFGDNGRLYRMMDFQYEQGEEYPFQTFLRCANEIGVDTEWGTTPCVPDYKHILPLYHRLMCVPLVIGEYCMGIFNRTEDQQPPRALVLGLGGGSWVGLLRELYPDMEIDCVEQEPVVIDHAIKFFGLRQHEKTNLIQAEAEQWLAQRRDLVTTGGDATKQYDLIFVDLYNTGDPPKCMEELSFYRDLDDLMAPKSILGLSMNSRVKSNYRAWRVLRWQFNTPMVLRYNPAGESGGAVVFHHKGWVVPDPLDFSWYRLRYLCRDWSYAKGLPCDVSKKLIRSASPPFPKLPQLFYASRIQEKAAEENKERLRQMLE